MYDFLQNQQINILGSEAVLCALMILFLNVMKFRSSGRKKALMRIEFTTAVMLAAETLLLLYEGVPGAAAHRLLLVCHFLSYFTIGTDIYFMNSYMTSVFMETGKFRRLPRRLLAGFIIPSMAMTLVVISQFTHIYYSISSENNYVRGPFYVLSYALPVLTLIISSSFIIQHRKKAGIRIIISLLFFNVFPLLAGFLQIFCYGISIMEICIGIGAVVLFIFALDDLNYELMRSANTEVMTGLPNTYGYLYEVDQVIAGRNITDYNGYYFDIAGMSRINSKYGKEQGDRIICSYAAYIRNHLEKNEILGRLGGNFFVALVRKEHTEQFLKMLRDIPVETYIHGQAENIHVSAVAGCYEIKKKNITAGQILGNTATAVSYAKNTAHKPYIFLDDELEAKIVRKRQLEETASLGLRKGEFVPYYQPKVDSYTGTLTGAEALVRWEHEGTVYMPGEFVPMFENNGMICDMDIEMLRHVCRDITDWQARGIEPVRISTNFSRKDLEDPYLADKIARVVGEFDIQPDLIQIEVTETLDEYSQNELRNLVDGLHRNNITSAIDDFGIGSSSISLLCGVPFDVMKIDRFFVECSDSKEEKLLEQIIRMAETLGLSVIAEGVEERSQLERLVRLGCREIQGYIFDRPLQHDAFEERLKNRAYPAVSQVSQGDGSPDSF